MGSLDGYTINVLVAWFVIYYLVERVLKHLVRTASPPFYAYLHKTRKDLVFFGISMGAIISITFFPFCGKAFWNSFHARDQPTSVQPPVLSLFSSVSTNPLRLFSSSADPDLLSDSVICFLDDAFLHDSSTNLVKPLDLPSYDNRAEKRGVELCHRVLHIQSPTLRTTFIRSPPIGSGLEPGITSPYIHIQVRNLAREWSFEVGVRTVGGGLGRIRCSTFQESAVVYPTSPPVLHLPLKFPALQSSTTLTSWSTIKLDIPSLLPHFAAPHLIRQSSNDNSNDIQETDGDIRPASIFKSVAYIKVYASCRLRRVWFSKHGEIDGPHGAWEFGLYG